MTEAGAALVGITILVALVYCGASMVRPLSLAFSASVKSEIKLWPIRDVFDKSAFHSAMILSVTVKRARRWLNSSMLVYYFPCLLMYCIKLS